MVRVWVLGALVVVAGCKKKPEVAPKDAEAAAKPKHKHVHHEDDETPIEVADGSGSGSGSGSDDSGGSDGSGSGSGSAQSTMGAHRDPNGAIHGPGGPIFEGRGKVCDAAANHCQRDGWFTAEDYAPGKFYRATPAFKLDGKWYSYLGEEVEGKGFRTEVAKPSTLKAGKPVIVFTHDNEQNDKFTDVEMDALTSSRWKLVVVDRVTGGAFTVRGWDDTFPIDSARVVVEQKP